MAEDLSAWLDSGALIDLDALPEVEEVAWRRIRLTVDLKKYPKPGETAIREGMVFLVFEGPGSENRKQDQVWIRLPDKGGFSRLEANQYEFLEEDGDGYELLPYVYEKPKPTKKNGTQTKMDGRRTARPRLESDGRSDRSGTGAEPIAGVPLRPKVQQNARRSSA